MSEANSLSPSLALLEPGTLWSLVKARTAHALATGALQSFATDYEWVEQAGVQFLVRLLVNLVRKEAARKRQDEAETQGQPFNPFLPYEEDLFVANLSSTHLCLLNKYNVVHHHLLIITRAFEDQESQLNEADFTALWLCLQELDGLAFYNSGKTAGASQPHKHLQLVPLPLVPDRAGVPIAALFSTATWQDGIGTMPELPFTHGLVRLDSCEKTFEARVEVTLKGYQRLLRALDLYPNGDGAYPAPYNLLATRDWLMLVPRSQESFADISVNSLGFAGALLVRSPEQLQLLKQMGPLQLLQAVGYCSTTS